ncbi:ubiquinol-cytochrome c reductase iron-sulfur subunit [Pseudonocardia acaciae]|uniref:QcrA and Rieske domain-containing protein n=1 Tax=Pseudonocardia acaciae TaxID=551276 RepID=UPI00048CFE50|nr:Rieske (2Fe-2S) protein [Pseudonocardia acaciae]
MTGRNVRRYVADLLRGRRPRAFRPDDDEAADLRAAIALRAARPGAGTPREEFVNDLHRRLAGELGEPAARPVDRTRRRIVQTTSIAAAAAAIGAAADHMIGQAAQEAPDTTSPTLVPNSGRWHPVAASAELAEGAVRGFELGSITGFVTRVGGQARAVSGACTHLGCKLAFNTQARRLDCPCHTTSFALDGQLLRHQLPQPPRPLPHFEVREADGMVQVFAPPSA